MMRIDPSGWNVFRKNLDSGSWVPVAAVHATEPHPGYGESWRIDFHRNAGG